MPDISIKYLQRNEIDDLKWNGCIGNASNSLIYAYTFYLDSMSPGWQAIVAGDYEYVMPLCWRRKWGISYLYQPTFVQQGGIFSAGIPGELVATAIFEEIRNRFRFAEIFLNYQNNFTGLSTRKNYILHLSGNYEILYGNYDGNLKKNLRIAAKNNLVYNHSGDLDLCLANFKKEYASRLPHVSHREFDAFGGLCKSAGAMFELVLRTATDRDENILASALILKKNNRMYLLQPYVSGTGRRMSANHFLFDSIIREFAGFQLVLDFEGSEIPGIARFYQSFGAVDQPYFFMKYNHLPLVVRRLKSICQRINR